MFKGDVKDPFEKDGKYHKITTDRNSNETTSCEEEKMMTISSEQSQPAFYVASFGYKGVIAKILAHYDLDSYFQTILTPSQFGFEDGEAMDDKNEMILSLGCVRPLLIDDSETNIDAAVDQGWLVYKVNPDEALTLADVSKIRSIMDRYHPDAIILDADQTMFVEHVTAEMVYPIEEEGGDPVAMLDPSQATLAAGLMDLLNVSSATGGGEKNSES